MGGLDLDLGLDLLLQLVQPTQRRGQAIFHLRWKQIIFLDLGQSHAGWQISGLGETESKTQNPAHPGVSTNN